MRLVMSNAHLGLREAILKVFPSVVWQRCKVHFVRKLHSDVKVQGSTTTAGSVAGDPLPDQRLCRVGPTPGRGSNTGFKLPEGGDTAGGRGRGDPHLQAFLRGALGQDASIYPLERSTRRSVAGRMSWASSLTRPR